MKYTIKGDDGYWTSCGWGNMSTALRYTMAEALEVYNKMTADGLKVQIDLED